MGLSEKELIKELLGVKGIGNARAKHILGHESMQRGFDDSGQFFDHLKGNTGKFGKGTNPALEKHFKREEEIAQGQADDERTTREKEVDLERKEFDLKKDNTDWAEKENAKEDTRKQRSFGGRAKGLMTGLANNLKSNSKAAAKQAVIEGWILIFPLLLAILDFFIGKNGIPLDFLWDNPGLFAEIVTRIVVHSPYWVFLVIYLILKKPQSKEEFLFPAVLFLVGSLTITFGGWNNWIFFHMVFAALTFVFLLGGFSENSPIGQKHWIFLIIFIIDIFGIATLKGLNAGIMGNVIPPIFLNRIIFPLWFFYYLALIKEGGFKTGMSIFIVLFYAGYIGFTYVGIDNIDIQDLDIETEQAKGAFTQSIGNWRDAMSNWFSSQVEYAITGKVEENEYEPLGVYLENVQPADPKYYTDEDVIIWGTVKARTLDDYIGIDVGCYVKDNDGKTKDKSENSALDVDPKDQPIEVFTFEEQDFVCKFTKDQIEGTESVKKILKVGTNTITTFADFNFETLAYLKTYFIDNERKRAMTREGLDVFEEFDIKDKNPVPVYTNGPVEIGMETTTPLIGVGGGYPFLSVSIQNRAGWEGKITKLTELVLFFPEHVAKEGCDEFTEIKEDEITNFCADSCKSKTPKCQETCKSLFEGGYTGYSLNLENLKVRDELKDFEKFKLFRCGFTPSNSVLGKTPITTEYFRVRAKYNYTLEKSVTVKIVEVPDKKSGASTSETTTTPTEISSELGHFEAFVDGINEMGPGIGEFSLELNKKSAIVGFIKGDEPYPYECYDCINGVFISKPNNMITKPSNSKCNNKACICLCNGEFKFELGAPTDEGICEIDFECESLENDVQIALQTRFLLFGGRGRIGEWENGFLFARGVSDANGLAYNDNEILLLHVEKKGNLIGVCNEEILDFNENTLGLPEGTCIQ